jgi:hypothetical protein
VAIRFELVAEQDNIVPDLVPVPLSTCTSKHVPVCNCPSIIAQRGQAPGQDLLRISDRITPGVRLATRRAGAAAKMTFSMLFPVGFTSQQQRL